jgi:hypothetical protein
MELCEACCACEDGGVLQICTNAVSSITSVNAHAGQGQGHVSAGAVAAACFECAAVHLAN